MAIDRDWQTLEKHLYMQTGKRLPIVLVRGEGTRVWDANGNEYLDFLAGIAVNVLGHSHPVVVHALEDQARKLIHVSNYFYTTPQIELAELLTESTGLDRVFFCNSGAEAVEGALKLARKWGKVRKGGAFEVIATVGGFHGRTMGALAATGTVKYRTPFEPLPPGFFHVPYNDLDAIKAATTPRTCAIIVEAVQGEAGVIVPDDDYLPGLRQWCDRNGILLIVDEVQTGVGRTGRLFGWQLTGARPDIMTVAKGLGGGVPIGAFLAREEVASAFDPGDHGTTFGGNPLATAVGFAVLSHVIEHDLPDEAASKGRRFISGLRSIEDRHPGISEVRGRGLMVAMELDSEVADELSSDLLGRGLIANAIRPTTVRFLPPLTVTERELDRALGIIEDALHARAKRG